MYVLNVTMFLILESEQVIIASDISYFVYFLMF